MAIESEIDALKAVDDALSAISEDARVRVLGWANSKYLNGVAPIVQGNTAPVNDTASTVAPAAAAPKKKAVKSKSKAAKKPKAVYKQVKDLNLRPSGKQSARDFVAEKKPSNLKHKCVVALYYLLHVLELDDAGIGHIYTFYKDVKWPVPSDLPNTLSQAGSSGWLDTADFSSVKITPTGENVVEHDLPKKQK